MKKLFSIIGFLLGVSISFAQSGFINNHPYSNPVTIENPLGAFHPQRGFILPFLDTANNPASVYNGAVVQNPTDSKPYYSDGVRWIPFLVGNAPTQINFTYLAGKYLTDFNTFGTLNTDSVVEAGNLYFTNARARLAISSLSPINYNNSTGVLSADTGILATRYDVDSFINAVPPKWNLTGNTGTTAGTNFIGTTDNVSLVFKVGGIRYGFLDAAAQTTGGNIAFGDSALIVATGIGNTAFGNYALVKNTTATFNTAIGYAALSSTTTSSFNTAVGFSALRSSTGIRNTAVGSDAGRNIVTGVSNTLIGDVAWYTNDGSFNTIIGHRAGYNATGNDNVFIGDSAGYNSTGNSRLIIANSSTPIPLVWGKFSNTNPFLSINGGPTIDSVSSLVSFNSTTKGFLLPRMNGVQMNAIASPINGLLIYNFDSAAFCYYNGGGWKRIDVATGSTPSAGTVTSIAMGYGLLPPTITNTGTLVADTSALGLSTKLWRQKGVDSLSALIGLKVNILDTASMLTSYLRKVDTTAMLSKYLRKTDTSTLSARINLKQNLVTLTTSGLGAATFNQSTGALNIPVTSGTGIDSIRRKTTTDTIRQWAAGVPTFAFRDNGLVDSIINISTTVQRVYNSDGTTKDNLFELDSAITTRIISSNVQLTNTTGGTTENTVYTGTIPANSIGSNGSFEIHALWSYPNNANNKTLRCRFNGTVVINRVLTTTVVDRWIGYISNRNSLTSQIAGGAGGGNAVGTGSSGVALSTFSFDTGSDITVTLTIQNASSGDASTTALEAFEIIANP